jgi:DNA-binding NarL/FixJ family response regulator
MIETHSDRAKMDDVHPRVVLADDHARVLARVQQLLSPASDVIAMVRDGWQAVEVVAKCRPDVAILDISMPRLDGLGAAREIRERQCKSPIVFLTVHEDEDYIVAALGTHRWCKRLRGIAYTMISLTP